MDAYSRLGPLRGARVSKCYAKAILRCTCYHSEPPDRVLEVCMTVSRVSRECRTVPRCLVESLYGRNTKHADRTVKITWE